MASRAARLTPSLPNSSFRAGVSVKGGAEHGINVVGGGRECGVVAVARWEPRSYSLLHVPVVAPRLWGRQMKQAHRRRLPSRPGWGRLQRRREGAAKESSSVGGASRCYSVTGICLVQWCPRVQPASQSVARKGRARRGGRAGAPFKGQISQPTGREEEGVGASDGSWWRGQW